MIFTRRHSAFIAALLLGACATQPQTPAIVTVMGTQAHGDTTTIAARTGDTVYTLSQYLHVDLRALIDQNNLTPPYALTPGQILRVPAPSMVTAHEGDTVFSIAQAYHVDQTELVRLNNLSSPYTFRAGQQLKLPSQIAPSKPVETADNRAQIAPVVPVNNASAAIHSEDLAPLPGATAPKAEPLHVGAATPEKQTAVASLTPPAKPAAAPVAEKAAAPTAKPAAKAKASLGTGTPKFSWPSNGSTLSDYGPKEGGRHNDGINIGAPLGSPVRTAAAGEVVYTGNSVAGFGNLILIRHSGGFATAYAHVQNPLVKRGEMVKAGQAIAQVGKTGNVSTPQLHFEIRQGTKPVNPKTYLP